MRRELIIFKLFNACDELTSMREALEASPLEINESKEGTPQSQIQEFFGKLLSIRNDDKLMLGAIEEQINSLQERKKRVKARIEHIRKTLLAAMQRCNIYNIECPVLTVSRGLSPHKVVIEDEKEFFNLYPEYFDIPTPKVNKKAIQQDLKDGLVLDNAKLVQKETIIIRRG